MGTSESYDLPSGTQWQSTKKNFSDVAGQIDSDTGNISKEKIGSLVQGFVKSAGGSSSYSRSGGGMGNSRAAVSAGHGIGKFLGEIAEEGVATTFSDYFGDSLEGKSADEICLELTDFFCDEATYINSADAKHAMYDLLKELLSEAEDLEEIETLFEEKANNEEVNKLIQRYFGYYVFEQIKRSFFSRLEERYGLEAAKKLIDDDIKRYILERVREEENERDLLSHDFDTPESVKVVEEILQEVISIFE